MEKVVLIYYFKDFKELYPFIIFDLRANKDMVSSQSVQARFRFRAGYDAVGQNLQAIGLLLTQKIISVSSDGQRQFDIVCLKNFIRETRNSPLDCFMKEHGLQNKATKGSKISRNC